MKFTLQQIHTLDTVVKTGSIQAAAKVLNRTHPSIIALLHKLEDSLGFVIFDRSGYRLSLTDAGSAFLKQAERLLSEANALEDQAALLNKGEEQELNICIGDLTPLPETLKKLKAFSDQYPLTRLNFLFENLHGPNERLTDGQADIIIHHINASDVRYEYQPFCQVEIIPVANPQFLKLPVHSNLTFNDLKGYTQCIIRDTSKKEEAQSFFILEDTPHITVGDQLTKKEIILQNMAWGHMPLFLVEEELKNGELISLQGTHLQGQVIDIVVARLGHARHGLIANKLWETFNNR